MNLSNKSVLTGNGDHLEIRLMMDHRIGQDGQ